MSDPYVPQEWPKWAWSELLERKAIMKDQVEMDEHNPSVKMRSMMETVPAPKAAAPIPLFGSTIPTPPKAPK